ncbi:hypothetical protein COB55_01840 [Candidatus Wolfebacteria bacterium]|nr:MAG: hypothetical protein COB55_01840 [Candidatus Wolfebacteria bacterium]
MEDLTKHQIVLLTLLISFVTSIATGIVTVTLIDQAPQGVTQTINRIVERTVERVVPAESQAASIITKEVTVVVNEDDLVIETVATGSRNVVRIFEKSNSGDETFMGLGVVITSDGVIATDITVGKKESSLSAIFQDGVAYDIVFLASSDDTQLALMYIEKDDSADVTFAALETALSRTIKLGQGVVSLGSSEGAAVSTGIVSKLPIENTVIQIEQEDGSIATSTRTRIVGIHSSVSPQKDVFGGPLFTFFGEIIGIHTNTQNGIAIYAPIDNVYALINEYRAERIAETEE